MDSPHELRGYRGRGDLAGMANVINARNDHEGGGEHVTVGNLAQQYEHLTNCDPGTDIVVAARDGQTVGYGRTTWDDFPEGRHYWVVAESLPDEPEVLADLYDWVEQRAATIAAGHPDGVKWLIMWADESAHRAEVLLERGYTPFRYTFEMVRPHLEDIPEPPLPDGVEVRPVEDQHLGAIWVASTEAFRDAWGWTEPTEQDWEAFLDDPNWDPSLWQVAWAGDRVVGQVRTYIDRTENEHFGRQRGWTEEISTAREWRRQGIAGSLICSSLRQLRDLGMTQAALGVDTESPTGAQRLYRSLGYEVTATEAFYRRAV